MSSEVVRNPSPPPEILSNEDLLPDRIGDSLYSKKWLYKTLMSIVELCENPAKECQAVQNESTFILSDSVEISSFEHPTESVENKVDMVELDPKIEADACTLWDMSASKDVAEFLNKSGVPDIFLDIIDKTKSPRLLEIIVGILGNMSSFDSTCQDISQNKNLVYSIVQLSGTSDTPTLLQVFRVILCGVSNQNSQNQWFKTFEESSFFFENMKFIFENSLNCSVIKGTFQVLHGILNENIEYCKLWGEPSYTKAIIEGGKQLLKLKKRMDNFFCVLDSLCQYTPNVKELVENWMELSSLFATYFLRLDKEDALPDRARVAAIFSCFDAYDNILKSESMKRELIIIDVDILKAMRKVACSVNSLVLNVRKDNMEVLDLENPSRDPPRQFLKRIEERNGTQYITMMTDYEFHTWTILGDTIIDTAKTLLTYAEKENEKEILEDILSSEVVKENIGILII